MQQIRICGINAHGVTFDQTFSDPAAADAFLLRAPHLKSGVPQLESPGITFTGPSSVPPVPAGPEMVSILVERHGVEPAHFDFTVERGDDATRDALFAYAAHLAAGVPDPAREVLFRTASGPSHLMAITPHNGAGIAKFTMPRLLREHLARG